MYTFTPNNKKVLRPYITHERMTNYKVKPCGSHKIYSSNLGDIFSRSLFIYIGETTPPPLLTKSGSFRLWVVSTGSCRPGSFRPYFRVSRFGLFWWVDSAVSRFCRGSFRPVSILVQNPLVFVGNLF